MKVVVAGQVVVDDCWYFLLLNQRVYLILALVLSQLLLPKQLFLGLPLTLC